MLTLHTEVELDSPTAYERMPPEERVITLLELRNFGTVEHPIFLSDFKRRKPNDQVPQN